MSEAEQNQTQNNEAASSTDYLTAVNQQLYARNLELAVRNKTLLLLRKLYDITLSALEPKDLANRSVHAIRESLNVELATIFIVGQEEQLSLSLLDFAVSERTQETIKSLAVPFSNIVLTDFANPCIAALRDKQHLEEKNFSTLWSAQDRAVMFDALAQSSHIESTIIFPLFTEQRHLGVLTLSLNGPYNSLSEFERESIESLVNVLSIAFDKTLVYEDLKVANEKLKELDVAKSEFMSIASHQLRTPLTGIMGYLSMIVSGDYGEPKPEQKPVLKDILEATKRLIRMVNIFLNATRIEAGRFILNYSKVPFHESIEAVYKELKPTADLKKVQLTYEPSVLPEVDVDPDKIKDVILNLIDNAIKYSPEGAVKVWASATPKTVHVFVKDTGVGIPKDEAPNLFNKFTRGSGIARVEPNGSGLGLFIAKKIVEEHGGRIWAESEGEGKGSTFQFEIPIVANPEAVAKAEEMKARVKRSAAAT
ncbi:MAG: GAF domain-containing sensor histidine kinase [Candidatus Kerfeldbacteria bacterium]|nr:GAF domain-containing sensor histidine kinase [Candidatus Kerfeldbacteria bacterium]